MAKKRAKEKGKKARTVSRKPKKGKKFGKRTRARKAGKVKAIKRRPAKEEAIFEEVVYKCPGCGRELRVVKVSGYDITSMLCQRCAMGGELMEEGE